MTDGCRYCGHHPHGSHARGRGSLHLAGDPADVFHGGNRLPLSATRAAILALLVRQGFASHRELLALRPTMSPESLKVTMHYIRELIPADMEIRNDHGKGYILVERVDA